MAAPKTYHVVGLMSGTSGDGLDMAFCQFQLTDHWSFEIKAAHTQPFPPELGHQLSCAHTLSGEELATLDLWFGEWMGETVKKFCETHRLKPDVIASHGHTVFHRPERGLTWQIGHGWSLSHASGFPVINDFRTLDVRLGGQGAPLAPVGDHYLFSQYDFCLNLGGISNISMLSQGQRVAFDISPFNLLLNHFAAKKGQPFDKGGAWARQGKINPSLLEELNRVDFYQQKGAKSLGREDLEKDFFPLLENDQDTIENILATLVAHYAYQISRTVASANPSKRQQLLITGGGAYNDYFIEQLKNLLAQGPEVILPEPLIIDFKEALIFAFLGVLRLRKEHNSFRSVTGAKRDSCGGNLFDAKGLYPG